MGVMAADSYPELAALAAGDTGGDLVQRITEARAALAEVDDWRLKAEADDRLWDDQMGDDTGG